MTPTLNPFITAEQERIRELVFAMFKGEYPVEPKDLKQLRPFVKLVREEFVESTEPGKRGVKRVEYFVLNDRGRHLYKQWLTGGLDRLA